MHVRAYIEMMSGNQTVVIKRHVKNYVNVMRNTELVWYGRIDYSLFQFAEVVYNMFMHLLGRLLKKICYLLFSYLFSSFSPLPFL